MSIPETPVSRASLLEGIEQALSYLVEACPVVAAAFEQEGDHLRAAGYRRMAERTGLHLRAHRWLLSPAAEEASREESEAG